MAKCYYEDCPEGNELMENAPEEMDIDFSCQTCEDRYYAVKQREAEKKRYPHGFMNAYRVTRHFGGHEEGGWWYDEGEALASIPLGVIPEEMAKQALKEAFGHLEWGNISSVRGGAELRVCKQPLRGRDYPDRKPHYE